MNINENLKMRKNQGCTCKSNNTSNVKCPRVPNLQRQYLFNQMIKYANYHITIVIIFSDSISVLKAMNHTSSKNPQIQKLLEKCHELLAYKEVVLCWNPSHKGIQGNEMVDKQAKNRFH